MLLDLDSLTLAFTTLRPTNRTSFDRRNPLMLVLLPIRLVDLCRLEDSHGTAAAALFAPVAPPPVLANSAAAAVLATVALSPVLAEAAAAAVLAPAAIPPVLTLLASHSACAQPVGRRLTNRHEVLPRATRSYKAPCWRRTSSCNQATRKRATYSLLPVRRSVRPEGHRRQHNPAPSSSGHPLLSGPPPT